MVCAPALANRLPSMQKLPLPGEGSALIQAGVRLTCACAEPLPQRTVDVEEAGAKAENPPPVRTKNGAVANMPAVALKD